MSSVHRDRMKWIIDKSKLYLTIRCLIHTHGVTIKPEYYN
jgi:hypothetical protein